ncbi:beta-lactamase family protein [Acinetobacter sp. 194]|uniref:serine hydrolase domain-containing protein n=1 Tax=Acinetobacter shaoyimingii TaxID=2715164 RepID=UPI00140D9E49|nr:serine hydrolase domain-containing protein [Acinetobacter shaoyimingii]NHB56729.1 beta-lactamase family protein [Acinetobacter shaoyimingii]
MKLFSTNTCYVPRDLNSITTSKNEVDPALGGLSSAQIEKIWSSVETLYKTGNHPLISVCIRRHGHIMINRSIGYRQGNSAAGLSSDAVIANPDTPICLFSASKLVSAMLVHILNEQGKINLLDPVSRYIPEFAANGKRRATIFHLLSHRGGIPKIETEVTPELLFDREKILQLLYVAKPVARAGSQLSYHAVTAGYILGELIERVTGQDIRDFLHTQIEKPMDLPFFNYGLKPELRDQVALNYPTGIHPSLGSDVYLKRVLGGGLELAVNVTNDTRFMDTVCPAGNIYTSAEQANRFMEMLLNGGSYQDKQIIRPETVFRATLPTSNTTIDRSLLAPMRYALGPMLGTNPVGLFGPNSGQAFGHLGFSNILCWADPERDISVSILNTGKSVLGTHLPALGHLLYQISAQCPIIAKEQRRSLFGSDQHEANLV